MLSLLDKALQAILKILKKKDERVLLWGNASPTSIFDEQDINVNGTGYDSYRVIAWNQGTTVQVDIPIGERGALRDFTHDTGSQTESIYLWTRYVDTTANKITFYKAWVRLTSNSTYSAGGNQNFLIPQKIYGIKSSGGAN